MDKVVTSVSSWASLAAQRVKNLLSMWETLERGMATHLSTVAWRIPWREELWATVHRVTKSQTRPSYSSFKQPGNIHLQLNNTIESFTYLLETKDVLSPVIWIMLYVFSF